MRNLKVGLNVTFHPIGGSFHLTTGEIIGFENERERGKRARKTGNELVKIRDEQGKIWFNYPDDIISHFQSPVEKMELILGENFRPNKP